MLHNLGFPASEGMEHKLYYSLFYSTVSSRSWKKHKQDQNCDLAVLKSMDIAKFEVFGHLQDVHPEIFSVIFLKFIFVLLVLIV